MKRRLLLTPLIVAMLCSCDPANPQKPDPTPDPVSDPVYSYVFNSDSPVKLTKDASKADTYSVTELSFKAEDAIKFVDSSVNPYKLVEDISISGERYGFSYNSGAFKASNEGIYSFTLSLLSDGNKLTISKKEEPIVNYYRVVFNANGHGAAPATIENVKEGTKISKPTDPTARGYIFEGWYKENSCLNEWNFSSDVVTSDITLYAKWSLEPVVNKYTVTFNANGHGSAPASITNVEEGSRIAKPADPSASGYIFGGWYKEKECVNAWNFNTDTVTANITLYAKWTEAPVETYTVTFDTQGHGIAPSNIENVKKGSTITKPADPEDEGYQFKGWFKENSCKNEWKFNVDKVTANITLYAKWEEVHERYFVVYSNTTTPFDIDYGSELTRISDTSYKVSLTKEQIRPGTIMKIVDSNNNQYNGYDKTTNSFVNYYVKTVTEGLQFVAFGSYTIEINPANTTSGIKVTNTKVENYALYEVNMNYIGYEDLVFTSSSETSIVYKYNKYRFGTHYTYSIRANINSEVKLFQNIKFSSKTSTKKFTLNGTSFTYSDSSAFGTEYFDVTLTLDVETLSLELDLKLR